MSDSIISPQRVLKHLTDPEWIIFDARFSLADPTLGETAYLAGHIPGAIYAHLDRDLSRPVEPGITGRHPLPHKSDWEKTLRQWGTRQSSQIVIYDDQIGSIASRLWWMLKWSGISGVAVMDGGWVAWQETGYPVDALIPVRHPSEYEPDYREEWIVSADDVNKWRQDPQHVVVDSREAVRYRGESEPIDPVAGHIPGAVNFPFADNVSKSKHWKSPHLLRDRFKSLPPDVSAENIAFYCGSGVTACHNILAYHQAGLGMPALYTGSWSHWITDPDRPVATGEQP